MPKNSIVTKFCHLPLGGPVIMRHRVLLEILLLLLLLLLPLLILMSN